MVLLLDIGNTNIKIGAVVDGEIVRTWRVATDHKKTADEYGFYGPSFFARFFL